MESVDVVSLPKGRGRPAMHTADERYEKWKNYMRGYMKKRFDKEKALRPPKEEKPPKPSKPYKGRPSISDKEREEKIDALIAVTEFKECKAPKKEKPDKEYFRKYYETHRDSLLNRANLRYHKKVIATRREGADPLIAEKTPASVSPVFLLGQQVLPSF